MRSRSLHMLLSLCLLSCLASCSSEAPKAVLRGKVSIALTRQGEEAPMKLKHQDELIEISALYMTISDVELHACLEDSNAKASWLDQLAPISTAWAHVPNSATRLGTPYVENWLSPPGKTRVIGELAPPLGTYCGITLILAPADRDVMNPTELATSSILEQSLVLQGRRRRSSQEEWQDFTLKSKARMALPVKFFDPKTKAPKLPLSQAKPSRFVRLTKRLDAALWQRPEMLEAILKGEVDERFITTLASSLQVYSKPSSSPSATQKP